MRGAHRLVMDVHIHGSCLFLCQVPGVRPSVIRVVFGVCRVPLGSVSVEANQHMSLPGVIPQHLQYLS